MTSEELRIIHNMEKIGGSFVQALAQCFMHADSADFNKLQNAFPEYWAEYKNFNH